MQETLSFSIAIMRARISSEKNFMFVTPICYPSGYFCVIEAQCFFARVTSEMFSPCSSTMCSLASSMTRALVNSSNHRIIIGSTPLSFFAGDLLAGISSYRLFYFPAAQRLMIPANHLIE